MNSEAPAFFGASDLTADVFEVVAGPPYTSLHALEPFFSKAECPLSTSVKREPRCYEHLKESGRVRATALNAVLRE